MISVPANEIYRCWQNPNKATPSYYKFVLSSINWPTARSSCIESGGHLVAMETDEEFLVIQQFVQHYFPGKEKAHGSSIWIIVFAKKNLAINGDTMKYYIVAMYGCKL